MARRKIQAGSTSISVPIFIQDTSSAVGAGLGSIVYNTSGLAAKYRREGGSSWTTITLATMTLGTWTSGGFITDGGSVTGGYELGVPDAALAAGAKWVTIEVYGVANMLAVLVEIELDAINYQDSVRAGLTALPNAAAEAAGGIITRGTGTGQLGITTGGKVSNVVLTDTLTTYTGNTAQTGDAYARLGAPAGASVSADIAGVQADTDNLQTRVPAALVSGRMDASVGAYQSGQAPLQPTVASRTLDVSAGGEAGVDWANVGTPGSTVGLSGTTVGTITTYTGNTPQTGDSYTRLGAPSGASIAADIAAVAAASAAAVWASATRTLSTAGIQAIWDALTSALTTSGSVGKRIADNLDTTVSSRGTGDATAANQTTILNRLGAWTGSGLNTILGGIRALAAKASALTPTDLSTGTTYDNTTDSTEAIRDRGDAAWVTGTAPDNTSIAAIKAKTDNLPASPAAVGSAMTLATDAVNAAALATSAVTELTTAIDAELSGVHGAGAWGAPSSAGQYTVTVTVRNSVTLAALPNALVTIKDSGDTTIIDQARTSLAGTYAFSLDAATYKVHVSVVPGYTSLAAQTLVVSANGAVTYFLVPITASAPAAPGLCVVQIFCLGGNGQPVSGCVGTLKLKGKNSAVSGALLTLQVLTATSNAGGYMELIGVQRAQFTHGDGVYEFFVVDPTTSNPLYDLSRALPNDDSVLIDALI